MKSVRMPIFVVYTMLILTVALCALHLVLGQDDPVIETVYGSVRGSLKSNPAGLAYEEYLGIPYGSPPIGENRFGRPIVAEAPKRDNYIIRKKERNKAWDGVRDAKEYSAHCVQFPPKPFLADGLSNITSEDCLYVNVFVPGENREGDDLAVIVFVHGGAYYHGTGALYPAYELGLHGDVIVVTLNYRLGPLGWLSTEDAVAPGNMGLWDTKLALEWVRDNIAAFGGDDNRVTVMGMSAGASMTSHVLVSPQTDSLLNRGITLSGASSAGFGVALPGGVADSTRLLARALGCNSTDSEEIITCLQTKDPDDINYWGFVLVVGFKRQQPNFIPVIDGDFVPMDPAEMWNRSAAANKDFIAGTVIHEGGRYVLPNINGEANHTYNLAQSEESLDLLFHLGLNHFPGNYSDMEQAIYDQYPDLSSADVTLRTQAMVNELTDSSFETPAHFEASQHAKATERSTYLYEYAYAVSVLEPSRNIDHDWIIAQHADDLHSVFGEQFREYYYRNEWGTVADETDSLVSDYTMSYYTNFANSGDPNNGLEVPVEWPQFNSNQREYLQISSQPQVLQETEAMLDNYRFWTHEFPAIANPEEESLANLMELDDDEFENALDEVVDFTTKLVEDMFWDQSEVYLHLMSIIDSAIERRA